MNTKKDAVDYLNWRHNYNKDDQGWCDAVMNYVKHLEETINELEGTLELSGVEPQEIDHGTVVVSCLEYLNHQKKFKLESDHSTREPFKINMEERLFNSDTRV